MSLGYMHVYNTSDTASATVNVSLYLSLTNKLIKNTFKNTLRRQAFNQFPILNELRRGALCDQPWTADLVHTCSLCSITQLVPPFGGAQLRPCRLMDIEDNTEDACSLLKKTLERVAMRGHSLCWYSQSECKYFTTI